jgi:hypothetical protein
MAFAPPDFLQCGTRRGQSCAAFFTESRMQFGGPPSSTGNPGSVYTNCETALEFLTRHPINIHGEVP